MCYSNEPPQTPLWCRKRHVAGRPAVTRRTDDRTTRSATLLFHRSGGVVDPSLHPAAASCKKPPPFDGWCGNREQRLDTLSHNYICNTFAAPRFNLLSPSPSLCVSREENQREQNHLGTIKAFPTFTPHWKCNSARLCPPFPSHRSFLPVCLYCSKKKRVEYPVRNAVADIYCVKSNVPWVCGRSLSRRSGTSREATRPYILHSPGRLFNGATRLGET